MNLNSSEYDFSKEMMREEALLSNHSMISNIEPNSCDTISYVKYSKLIPFRFKNAVDELGVVARYYALPSIFFANKVLSAIKKDATAHNSKVILDENNIIWSENFNQTENSHIMSVAFLYDDEEIVLTFVHPCHYPKGCVVLIAGDNFTTIEIENYLKQMYEYALLLIAKNKPKSVSENNEDNFKKELLFIKSDMENTMTETEDKEKIIYSNKKEKEMIKNEEDIIIDSDITTHNMIESMKTKLYTQISTAKSKEKKKNFIEKIFS